MGWKDESVKILSGEDIISVNGLTITGLKPGEAKVKNSATTDIHEYNKKAGYEEKVYSTDITINVE